MRHKYTTQSLLALGIYLYNSKCGGTKEKPLPVKGLKNNYSFKGWQFLSFDMCKALFLLPQWTPMVNSKRRHFTVTDCKEFIDTQLPDAFDTKLATNIFGSKIMLVKCKLPTLGAFVTHFKLLDESIEDPYPAYLRKANARKLNKASTYQKDIFTSQAPHLAKTYTEHLKAKGQNPDMFEEFVGISTEEWILAFSSFHDNRLFSPITNLKKSDRVRVLPFEIDLHASQIVFLSNLIKRTSGESLFTGLVDFAVRTGRDVYEELAKAEGSELSRTDYKKKLFEGLFGIRDNFITLDKGYKKTLSTLCKGPQYDAFIQAKLPDFLNQHSKSSFDKALYKFNKIYIRTFLTHEESVCISVLAKQMEQPFVTIHDCVALTQEPTEATFNLITSIEKRFSVRFTYKEASKTRKSYVDYDINKKRTPKITSLVSLYEFA